MVAVGLVLVIVAVVLLLFEAHVPTGGLIAGGAILAVAAGVALLLAGAGAGTLAVLAAAGCVGVAGGVGLVLTGRTVVRARRVRPRTGPEALVGHMGTVRGGADRVFVDGALWRAEPQLLEPAGELRDGDRVVVERVKGLTLCVRKAEEWELSL